MTLTMYQKIIIVLVLVVFSALMYEEIFHLVMETLHILFESIEYVFDLGVEHLFETGTHETQVIVFYILAPIVFVGFYLFWRLFFYVYHKLKRNVHLQAIEILAQWQALSMFKKIACWFGLMGVISCGLFFTLM